MSPAPHQIMPDKAMRKGGVKVLAAAGSSGGHIFPALGFLDALRNKDKEARLLLVLPKRVAGGVLTGGIEHKLSYISVSPFALRLDFKNAAAALNFFKGLLQSLFLLFEFRPDIVVGFGSFDSLPVLLSAWLLRIKTMIHEQNVIPGRANRLLAKFADKVAVSFVESGDYLKVSPKKVVYTGNPIRSELKKIDRLEALRFFEFDDGGLNVVAMGGSQGSRRINSCFLEAVSMLADKSALQVIHIAGENERALLEKKYREMGVKARVEGFLRQMHYAYSICDLAVSRAGAAAIAELIYFRIPAIIVPYPFAYQHQLHNARTLEKMGAAVVIHEQRLEAAGLSRLLEDFIGNPERLKAMRSCYGRQPCVNSGQLLAAEALSLR